VTPAARLAAAIEILDTIAAEKLPADQVLKAWGREHRFAGSGDRRAIAERCYQALRARARLAWAMDASDGRALVIGSLAHHDGRSPGEIAALFSGDGHAPAPLTAAERARLSAPLGEPPLEVQAGVPAFVAEALKAQFGGDWLAEAQALVQPRAPVDLRVNALRGGVEAALNLLAHEGVEPARTPYSAWGLRLPPEFAADIQKTRAFRSGWIEVQDEASQIAAALAGARPGATVVDYCAGGGGKTLALAAGMHPSARPPLGGVPAEGGGGGLQDAPVSLDAASTLQPPPPRAARSPSPRGGGAGRLLALDVNRRRLDALPERLERAGAQAEVRRIGPEGQGSEDLEGQADLVFVDAPCSGSGTWRRRPEGAWRVTADDVERLAELQAAILARASALVKPGGRLVYATCSVIETENQAVAAAFAAEHADFRPVPVPEAAETPHLNDAARARLAAQAGPRHTVQLTPRRTGTDGFFVALFERMK
jgi:16S rRNA (cytosine967-C5)-methyltransferase